MEGKRTDLHEVVNLTFERMITTSDFIEHIYSVDSELRGKVLDEAIGELIKVPHSSEYWIDRKGVCGTEYFFTYTAGDEVFMDRIILRRRR